MKEIYGTFFVKQRNFLSIANVSDKLLRMSDFKILAKSKFVNIYNVYNRKITFVSWTDELCLCYRTTSHFHFFHSSMYTLTTKYVVCAFYRLPQRSHLRTLKNFVSEKSGKRFEKSGKYCIKSGNREISRRFIFFLYPRLELRW